MLVGPEDETKQVRKLTEQSNINTGFFFNPCTGERRCDGTGTDVAIESAATTLLRGDLQGIVKAKELSQAVMRNIKQNLFFAFVYNVLGIPIAAGKQPSECRT